MISLGGQGEADVDVRVGFTDLQTGLQCMY